MYTERNIPQRNNGTQQRDEPSSSTGTQYNKSCRVFYPFIILWIVFLAGILAGLLPLFLWMGRNNRADTKVAIQWTIESVTQRFSNKIGYEFLISHQVSQLMLSAVHVEDLPIVLSNETSGEYDPVFLQYRHLRGTSIISGVYITTINKTSGDVYMTGGCQLQPNSSSYEIMIYNGTCLYYLDVDINDDRRVNNNPLPGGCVDGFDIHTRNWYILAQNLTGTQSKWTDSYFFHNNYSNTSGMTLVTKRKAGSDIEFIICVDALLENIQRMLDDAVNELLI
ncbi:hypothetical protein RFI_25689, partial [Reticulomyxa filosa]